MAQLVARLHGMEEVWGSNPHSSTRSWEWCGRSLGAPSPPLLRRVCPGGDPRTPGVGAPPPRPLPVPLLRPLGPLPLAPLFGASPLAPCWFRVVCSLGSLVLGVSPGFAGVLGLRPLPPLAGGMGHQGPHLQRGLHTARASQALPMCTKLFLDRGAMAQLVARLHGMEEVWGSNPHSSTQCFPVSRPGGLAGAVFARVAERPDQRSPERFSSRRSPAGAEGRGRAGLRRSGLRGDLSPPAEIMTGSKDFAEPGGPHR